MPVFESRHFGRLLSRGMAAAVASALGGCLQTNIDLQAAQDMPPAFTSKISANVPNIASSVEFWTAFHSPQLVNLVRQAEAGSQDLAAAIARIDMALAARDQASTALLPSGSLGGTQTWERGSATAQGLPPGYKLPDTKLTQVGLSASYQIDFWGQNAALLRSADSSYRASRYDAETVRLTVTAQVATLYLQAVSLKDQISVARQNVKLSRQVADSIRQRVDAGSATATDKARQDTIVLQQEASVPALNRTLADTQIQLAVLLGTTPGQVAIEASSLDGLALPTIAPGIPTDLLHRRPDIAAAEDRLLASAENVTAARAAMLPSFSLTGSVGQESQRFATLFSPYSYLYQTVAGVTVPLFDQFRLAAQLRGAKANQDQLIATYRGTILAGLAEVETALADLRNIQREEVFLSAAAREARRAYSLSTEQLEAGQIDVTSVLLTQTSYFQAVGDLKQIQLARYQAAVALFKAVGGGWTAQDVASAKMLGLADTSQRQDAAKDAPATKPAAVAEGPVTRNE